MNSNPPTAQKQRAISARGNVLVVDGAGAGKTQTMKQEAALQQLQFGVIVSLS